MSADRGLKTKVERFDHQRAGASDDHARGTRFTAVADYPDDDLAVSMSFPDVYITDAGTVEIDDFYIPARDAVAWLRELADHIDARQDAS